MESMKGAININVDAKIKNEATTILKELGLSMSTFINMALIQVIKRNGVPFEVTNPSPSKELLESLKEADEMANNPQKYPRYNNWKDLEKALLSDD